jgi:hypothetical protein
MSIQSSGNSSGQPHWASGDGERVAREGTPESQCSEKNNLTCNRGACEPPADRPPLTSIRGASGRFSRARIRWVRSTRPARRGDPLSIRILLTNGSSRIRCTPRMTGSGGGFTLRGTVSCASAGAGAHRASQRMSGTAGGWKPGRAIRIFSGTPSPPQRPATHHPGFIRCAIREPSPRAKLCRNAPPAFSRAQPSPDRASGVRGGRLQCACGRTSALG